MSASAEHVGPPVPSLAAWRLANDMIAGSVKSPDWPGNVSDTPEAWDPQRRVFAAIEQSRGALGQVEPLSEMERAQIRDCLARVGVPAQAAGVVE